MTAENIREIPQPMTLIEPTRRRNKNTRSLSTLAFAKPMPFHPVPTLHWRNIYTFNRIMSILSFASRFKQNSRVHFRLSTAMFCRWTGTLLAASNRPQLPNEQCNFTIPCPVWLTYCPPLSFLFDGNIFIWMQIQMWGESTHKSLLKAINNERPPPPPSNYYVAKRFPPPAWSWVLLLCLPAMQCTPAI